VHRTFEAIYTNDVAVSPESFVAKYGREFVVPWDSVRFVGAVQRFDGVAFRDDFFWAIVSSAATEHFWIPMAAEFPEDPDLRTFEDELGARGLIPSELPAKSAWGIAEPALRYLSVCVYPSRCAGMPLYAIETVRRFLFTQSHLALAVA
jgi:hypothetical protein